MSLGYSVGFGLILALLCFCLKSLGFGGSRLFSAVGVLGLVLISLGGLERFFSSFSSSFARVGMEGLLSAVLKILGVGYLFGICSDICREMGENGVAGGLLAVGRVEILLLSLPYLTSVIELAEELLRI